MRRYAISFRSHSVLSQAWREALSHARLKAVELSCAEAPPAGEIAEQIPILKRLVEAGELTIPSIHLPFAPFEKCAYTALDERERKRTVAETLAFLESYSGLGIRNITIHCGGEPNLDRERAAKMEQMQKTVSDLLPFVESWGASLNLELLPRSCIGNHEDELLSMVRPFPEQSVNVCLDVNHLMGRFRELPEVIAKLAPRLRTLHISDHDGIDECHWYVGQGVIDWCAVMAALQKIPQDLLLILEISPYVAPRERPVDPRLHFRFFEREVLKLEYADELDAMDKKNMEKLCR